VGSGFPKDHAEIVFQLPDPGGDVGLRTMQPFRRARHAAFAHDGTGDAQIGHISSEDLNHHNYSFYRMSSAA
jgi:hypothetical protein